ncbi:MAG: hypothetical protein JXR70_04530 [Spirochaetales bacterium]|nr:hypothetical protein [Spirochaetales bacterium]
MKKIFFIILCFFLFLPLFAQKTDNQTLAILDVVGENVSSTQLNLIYEYIIDRMNRSKTYTLVERSALNRALEELEISMSDIVDESTAVQIGKVAGAKYVLITSLIKIDSDYHLSMRVVNVETSKIENTAIEKTDKFSNIDVLTQQAVDRLFDIKNGSTITKPAEDIQSVDKPEVVKEDKPVDKGPENGDLPDRYLSLSGGGGITIPILDVTRVFDLGYQFIFNAYYCMKMGPGYGGVGIQTGAVFEFTRTLKDPEWEGDTEYTLLMVPAYAMVKYKLYFGDFYAALQAGGGVNLSSIMMELPPDAQPEEMSAAPLVAMGAVTGGITGGMALSETFGLSIYANYLHGFYKNAPYTGVIAGAQLEIRM